MRKSLFYIAFCSALAACGTPSTDINGNPIPEQDSGGGEASEADENDAILRSEPQNADLGDGYLRAYSYNAADDTFFVEGLGFDGNQPGGQEYSRVSSLGIASPFAVYEAPAVFPDSVTGTPVPQFDHRAIYGVSASKGTEFAIVRTGSYIGYGFGGFIYQRKGSVDLPAEGQATYEGPYAALRDFNGRGGLEYAEATALIDIDFSGFRGSCEVEQCDNAVRGVFVDRKFYSTDGVDITRAYLDALEAKNEGASLQEVPALVFRVGPGFAKSNGEINGSVFTPAIEGISEEFLATGNYYAIMSGDHTSAPGGEIVGIMVTTSEDPRSDGVTVRETGGFIVTRQ
ncbi:hypothetical protein [Marivita geojedonensis]|uniref:Transferrin-binding protein B C-lobe/N-lobe beta barrel domain-containing protein n=1 Tax=Marivita geojedonensis TaxID=1123756 RepID=A0A1X4NC70_9RHOB|nr:hypothetical protein [Marivita geojedonensis]OSQ44321.1 hypothetical protein MGEO_19080 [Marivita geojedonensis]PRY72914.1 hypothetical protein CLV76_13226 [Marivita geojedonensis]